MDEHKTKKRITLSDIAELSGVSKTTVSMILNGRGETFRIKEETCQKVKEIAQRTGYRANIYAKSLQSQRSNAIGLVIPDLTNYGFAQTAKILEKLCREHGLQLLIACSDDQPQQEMLAIESLLDRQIDLLITAPTHQNAYFYDKIYPQLPLLQLDRYLPELDTGYIISNDTPKIAEMVSTIIQRHQPKEFFYIGGQLSLSPSESRLAGFRQGLEKGGLKEQENWILHKDYQPESGYQMCQKIVEQLGRLPEAIFTSSYTLLEGVLRYLTENQKMQDLIERKLHLSTFDDHDILNALPFHIHSIRQNHELIAQHTFTQLYERLQEKEVRRIEVECHIVWR